jgi:tetratricopeptide (TPR) repeat protein
MQMRGHVLHDAGRLEQAVVAYREALDRLQALGMTSFASTTTINLAETLYALGDVDHAERLAVQGEEMGAAEDVVNFAAGRALRAHISVDRGELAEAERLARSAVEYAERTDFPSVHATAHEALAHALVGEAVEEARAEYGRAAELWSRYGYRVRADRARELLVQL